MKFFMIFLVLMMIPFFVLPHANATQIDAVINPQNPESQFTSKYYATVSIEYDGESKIKDVLKDKNWTISKTAYVTDSDSIALATKLNQKISEDGSGAKISDLSVEYQATLQGKNNYVSIDYIITLTGTLSNYVLDSDDSSGSTLVDVNWRGLSVVDPVLIGDYDINSPLSAIIEKEPEIYSLMESHPKIIDLLSENLLDAENIMHYPLSKWHFSYGPMGLGGEISEDTMSEYSVVNILTETYPEKNTVTETFTADNDYVVGIMRPVDSASMRIAGFATIDVVDEIEILGITSLPPDTLQFPRYETISGNYTNEEFGFSLTLPDSIDGFLTEIDHPSIGKIVNFQIHPEMEDEVCCPTVDPSPIVILFDSNPKAFYSIPIPMTNGIHASFQGYGMNVKIENLDKYQVLTSTLDYEREFREFPEPIKQVGKFYFINTGDRYISYGILASEENYEKYIETFEKSAKSLTAMNAIPVNIDELFPDKNFQAELRLEDNSSIFPKITTPSTVTSLIADKPSKSLQINFTEPNDFRSFLAINIGDLIEGPYEITFDEKHVEVQILENESGKYLIVFYSGQGQHNIRISGSSINSISNPSYQIEKINDMLYYVSESLDLNPDLMDKIIFQGVVFTPTYIYDPPSEMHSYVMNADGQKEIISVHFDEPVFSERVIPQAAGIVGRADGYHLLVSVNLKGISPLKQFQSGIPLDEIQCKDNFVLIQKQDGSPVCVKYKTAVDLTNKEKRSGWNVSDQLWKLLSEKMDELSPENNCPRYCLVLDEKYVVDGIDKTLGNSSGLPKFLPEGYDNFQFHHRDVYSVIQISTKPISLDTSWNDFYWKDNGIFLRYSEVPITMDGRAQTADWAKTHDAKTLDLPSSDEHAYLKEREISYSDELDMLYPTFSEAQFNYGELVVVISGYISGENMLKIADSFFEK